MKKYKIFNKTGLAICLTLGLVAGSACSPTDDGPSIDDHFLNYEIPQIRPSSDIPVGAIYWNLGSTGVDEKKYARLIGEYNQSGQYPQLCPNVRPVLVMLRRLQLTAWLASHSETATARRYSPQWGAITVRLAQAFLLQASPLSATVNCKEPADEQ